MTEANTWRCAGRYFVVACCVVQLVSTHPAACCAGQLVAAHRVACCLAQLVSGHPPEEADQGDDPVVAEVNNHVIRLSDVKRQVEELRQRLPWPASWEDAVQSAVLASLVDRWIVLEYLAHQQVAATAQDVEHALAGLRGELEARGRTLGDYCRQLNRSEEQLRELLWWSLSWRRYLDRFLTEANVRTFFDRHRRQFDGTRLRVAHILWRVTDPQEIAAQIEQASAVRKQILSGEMAFSDAAAKLSQAPTASKGGDIGWIERRHPMPESFSRAAFELKVGEISQPVVTSFGVHLITCLEEQPGQRTLDEVRPQVEAAMAAYLFRWAVDRHRNNVKIIWKEQLIKRPDPVISRMLEAPIRDVFGTQ